MDTQTRGIDQLRQKPKQLKKDLTALSYIPALVAIGAIGSMFYMSGHLISLLYIV